MPLLMAAERQSALREAPKQSSVQKLHPNKRSETAKAVSFLFLVCVDILLLQTKNTPL